jgi:uncharacterized protein YceH (UPF0502 family)
MDIVLTGVEARILGCLIEKEMTTPEYYPLTLNALTNACNQKSNRNPLVSYDEATVEQGLDSLRKKGLVISTMAAGSRVKKYLHTLLDRFDFSNQEKAILCEFLVRGPQTVGEIRSRAERMAGFENLEEVERILQGLMDQEQPLIRKLPREIGRKESRYMHLLSNEPGEGNDISDMTTERAAQRFYADHERIGKLEEELKQLRDELEELKKAFTEFRSQF